MSLKCRRSSILLSCAASPLVMMAVATTASTAQAQTATLVTAKAPAVLPDRGLGSLGPVLGNVLGGVVTPVVTVVPPVVTTTTTTLPILGPVVVPVLSPVVVTTAGLPGTVGSTGGAAGSVVGNAVTDPLSLLQAAQFSDPPSDAVDPKWGKIRSFWGKIRSFQGDTWYSPFLGSTRGFWGDTGPFEGNIGGWWGSLRTYNDDTRPAAGPQWSSIRAFWDGAGSDFDSIRTSWDASDTSRDYSAVATKLNGVVTKSASFWGSTIQAKTGKSFEAGFASALLQRYGIDLNNPASLAGLDVNEREHFFLEYYDGLMQYSGADSPDHWMRQIGWSPSITQIAGEGSDTVIGLLDFTVTGAETGNVTWQNGVSSVANGHGAAVASLMVAPHDGKGVMGIAPRASVVSYNPFDSTQTANWRDIRDGIVQLGVHKASIVNMSLGVSGWTLNPDWNNVFKDPLVQLTTPTTVFVIAAGNDGISQTQNVAWSNNASVLIVGSVDPTSTISTFSNRPGTACLLTNGVCKPGDRLMDHFIVAPGEMILVSDGQGGVTRYSGTSFAAPLVSGTIALIHDRWPWLAKYPRESIDIILKTATDLGAPGTDAVYGVGQLNVTAALSPISYDKLTWYGKDDKGQTRPMSSTTIKQTADLARWEASGMYFYAFETIGSSYRDFAIPLSSKLVDSSTLSAGLTQERFQSYLWNQVTGWLKKGFAAADERASLNLAAVTAPVANPYGMNVTMALAPRTLRAGFRDGQFPYQTMMRFSDRENRIALKLGSGDGAIELGDAAGFARASDYDSARGGANPLLGMASGGGYAQISYSFTPQLSLAAGVTQRDIRYDKSAMPITELASFNNLSGYRTGADTVSLSYRPRSKLALTASYTRLHEQDAILGIQALDPGLLGGGAATEGVTMGAAWTIVPGLQLAASGTVGRTRSNASQALIATDGAGLRTTAWQVAMSREHLFDDKDALWLSVAQPLYIEHGSLAITSVQVIDRQTGALGEVTQRFAIPGKKRPMIGEFHYSRSLAGGRADLAMFGTAQFAGDPVDATSADFRSGLRFQLRW